MPAAPYLTPADLRGSVDALADSSKFSDALLEDLVDEFETIAEEYRGVAYTPRDATETRRVCGQVIVLTWPKVITVTSVTVDGVATTGYEVDKGSGVITLDAPVDGDVVVVYSHGEAAPSTRLLRACRQYVRSCAMADISNTPRDIVAERIDGGFTRFSTAAWNAGRPTGFLEVDRILNSLPDYRSPQVG